MSDDISALIGVLLDVSYSMKASVGEGVDEKLEKWIESVIQVIDDLITHDVSDSNQMFAVGVGARSKEKIFDFIGTLELFQSTFDLSFEQKVERILQILELAGAKYVRNWADINIIKEVASNDMVNLILLQLEMNSVFKEKFVNDFLPGECTKGITGTNVAYLGMSSASSLGLPVGVAYSTVSWLVAKHAESVVSSMRPTTKEEIEEVMKKANEFLKTNKTGKNVSFKSSLFDVREAHRIFRKINKEISNTRRKELLEAVEHYIFGLTPLYKALKTTTDLFVCHNNMNKKLLFILSDGESTDDGDKMQLLSNLQNAGVLVVSCFITSYNYVDPKCLYNEINKIWSLGAKFLFDLSSKLPTQLLPRTIFIKRGWKIDIENNETRLFVQVNHPDHIRDACDLARNVVCCQDALADILGSVDHDISISQYIGKFPAHLQVGDTCYANASATVIHLSTKRILGRKYCYPDFDKLRRNLISRCSIAGANTFTVLQNVCPEYRLHCKEVDIKGAMHAITAKRPVVATFRLSQSEFKVFDTFFGKHPTGILSKKEIDITKRRHNVVLLGHAVVLTSFNSECLRFMNSGGIEWGDKGFFRVRKADVLDFRFIDVFWTEADLHQEEKDYYEAHGTEVAEKLMHNLKGLQAATYQCPLCRKTSYVTEFSGNLSNAKCPRCHGEFKSDEGGNILALNIYLTSLSR